MKKLLLPFCISSILILIGCDQEKNTEITSPNAVNSISFGLSESGAPYYQVFHGDEMIIDTSYVAFDFKEQKPLREGFRLLAALETEIIDPWEMPWGEQREVMNHYKQLLIELEEEATPNRRLNIYFRAYDDGVAFRYEFPEQDGVDSLVIMDEHSQFKLTGDHMSWWIPGDWDIYEHLYNTSRVSEIDAIAKRDHPNLASTYIPENAVNTPVTMRMESGTHLSFHEADLTDYAGMTLKVDPENLILTSELVGSDRLGYKVKRALPFETPWRTIQIAEDAGGLIESNLIVNLNDPNILGDVSYFTPMKYIGIWWEMHVGVSTWDLEGVQDMNTWTTGEVGAKKHGATTENAKRYIDFASENGIKGLLVEGWNTGWDQWINTEDREGVFDFMTPYPDYDFDEVVRYAKEKGVEIIMHHETSAAPRTYEKQMDEAYDFMKANGMNSVKTGYVGKIIPKGEYHHGQWMVQHYHKVLEEAAKKEIAVNAHEPIKGTGKRRTYPNAIAREGLRGQEFNAWSIERGNPPEHLPIVAFTRMLSGPIDFTPGVFDIGIQPKPESQINTTLAQQLALYVVIYSPIQMACDLPENYEGQPAFQFIRDVGVDWEQSVVLNGEVGDFVTIAREERDTGNWFVGGISDENARELTVDLDFLPEGKTFSAVIYKDGPEAHYRDNPTDISIEAFDATSESLLSIPLASGGGFAISLIAQND